METINHFLTQASDFLWGWPMIILLLGTHVYLTIRLRFPQRKIFTAIRLSVVPDKDAKGDVSQFGALATALAATIGTGNIIGIATAVSLGGPGAVFWCWLTGVFGIATKYSEGLLAMKYRVKTAQGTMLGGPMYALERGLGWKWLAVLFAVFAFMASFGIGSTVQANAISVMAEEGFGISPWVTAVVVTLLVSLVVLGGIKSIAKVCGALVPSAFSSEAAGGGFVGGSIIMAARYGIARGLFSNESGLGSAPIAAAAAQARNPVRQALVSATGTFWDTVVICALTGIVIVSSILMHPDIDYSHGGTLTKMAFSKIPVVGTPFLSIALFTFAFSTILGWCYYGERCVEYLARRMGNTAIIIYRSVYIVTVFVGSVVGLGMVWNLADCMNALMALPNLVSLLLLSGVLVRETRKYLWEDRLHEWSSDHK